MAEQNRKTLQDFFLEEKEKLDAVERERQKLKQRFHDSAPVPRPSDDLIDRSLGEELSEQKINDKAHAKAWTKYKQQEAQAKLRKEIDAKNKVREEKLKKSLKENVKKSASRGQNKKPSRSADEWAKDETRKRQNEGKTR